ncbi:E3 ubiquitin-protein ligase TRAIP [Condylostylus longicornis]|uniref:E3 ubiquitin-protein ligase TRAIP n=1 Tax=Condylostylus longicornis TaxID=2530218 RepID=UPI00244E5318|nr:E3 ubiquitin-protein ligase TRAIP [Condylostylus longicornis]
MNLTCVICAELFVQADDVHATHCGHLFHQICLIQWLERSKTCPQCRHKCYQKSHHKIYFNIGNLDTSNIDIASVQQQLDDAKLQNQLNLKEQEKLKKEIDDLKGTRKKCLETITALESKLESNKFALSQFAEQVKVLKCETKLVETQRNEIDELKKQIQLMETVQKMISSTTAEVEQLLEQDSSSKSLATWVVLLKKELRACESKKADIRNTLKSVQHDLRKSLDAKRNLESKLSALESENYQLNSKVESLEKQYLVETSDCNNDKNYKTKSDCQCNKKNSLNFEESVINFNENSPGILKKVKEIVESDSPYLNIKSSSLGLKPILKVADRVRHNNLRQQEKVSTLNEVKKPDSIFETHSNLALLKKSRSEDLRDKYSIFKKPRLIEPSTTSKSISSLDWMVPNGFGGSEKRMLSPTKPLLLDDEAKAKFNNVNNRLKAGKLRKISSATQLNHDNTLEKFIKRV